MTKQSGLGDNLYVDGFDVSGDIGSIQTIHGGPAALECTGIDKSGFERFGGQRDAAMEYSAWFNDAATPPVGAHFVLSPLTTLDRVVTYCRGTVLGNPSACIVAKQTNYDPTRAADGALTWAISKPANGFGLEWGRLLTAGKRTDSGAANGTGVDFAVASVFGLQAYLQVFAFTGTSVTVKIQESSDNGGGDAFADVVGGSFVAATAIGSQRIATATGLSVERYLRVVTTGTFSNAVFAVTVVRNETLAAF
jgi:hypothetical protein